MEKIINYLKKLLLLVVILTGAVTEMQAQIIVRRPGGVAIVGRPVAPVYYGPWGYGPGVVVPGVPSYSTVTYTESAPRYYYSDGVYYAKKDHPEDEITDPENLNAESESVISLGTVVPALPDGAKKTQIDGNTYFEYENVLYKEVIVEDTVKYKVVAYRNPSDQSDKKSKKKNKK